MQGLRRIVRDAVEELVTRRDEFWLHSLATDRSFEEGERSAHCRDAIETFRECGFSKSLCESLAKGINGNLAQILRANAGDLQ
jgi:hypothetical protein